MLVLHAAQVPPQGSQLLKDAFPAASVATVTHPGGHMVPTCSGEYRQLLSSFLEDPAALLGRCGLTEAGGCLCRLRLRTGLAGPSSACERQGVMPDLVASLADVLQLAEAAGVCLSCVRLSLHNTVCPRAFPG